MKKIISYILNLHIIYPLAIAGFIAFIAVMLHTLLFDFHFITSYEGMVSADSIIFAMFAAYIGGCCTPIITDLVVVQSFRKAVVRNKTLTKNKKNLNTLLPTDVVDINFTHASIRSYLTSKGWSLFNFSSRQSESNSHTREIWLLKSGEKVKHSMILPKLATTLYEILLVLEEVENRSKYQIHTDIVLENLRNILIEHSELNFNQARSSLEKGREEVAFYTGAAGASEFLLKNYFTNDEKITN